MRHRSLPPSLPPQDHHLGGKAAEPVGPRVITSQKKAKSLSRRLSGGPGAAPCGLRALDIVASGGRSNGRKSAGKGHGRTAGHRPVRGQILLLAKKKSRGVVGDHVGVVGSVCWSWKRLRARAGEVKNSCRFFGSDLPSGPGATGTAVIMESFVYCLAKVAWRPCVRCPSFSMSGS